MLKFSKKSKSPKRLRLEIPKDLNPAEINPFFLKRRLEFRLKILLGRIRTALDKANASMESKKLLRQNRERLFDSNITVGQINFLLKQLNELAKTSLSFEEFNAFNQTAEHYVNFSTAKNLFEVDSLQKIAKFLKQTDHLFKRKK